MNTRVSLGRKMGRHSMQPWGSGVGKREDGSSYGFPSLGLGPTLLAPLSHLPFMPQFLGFQFLPRPLWWDCHCQAQQRPPSHQVQQQLLALTRWTRGCIWHAHLFAVHDSLLSHAPHSGLSYCMFWLFWLFVSSFFLFPLKWWSFLEFCPHVLTSYSSWIQFLSFWHASYRLIHPAFIEHLLCAMCTVWLKFQRYNSKTTTKKNRCPPGAYILCVLTSLFIILGQTWLPRLETHYVSSFWIFSPGFPIRTSDLICEILKAPTSWEERADLLVSPACSVSVGVLSPSKPSLTPVFHCSVSELCCVSILFLESGLAGFYLCFQLRTSAHLPAVATHPGSSQLPERPAFWEVDLTIALLKRPVVYPQGTMRSL